MNIREVSATIFYIDTASVTGLAVDGSATAILSTDKTVMTITFKLGAMTGDVANWSVSVR